jgi:hypothetical protein
MPFDRGLLCSKSSKVPPFSFGRPRLYARLIDRFLKPSDPIQRVVDLPYVVNPSRFVRQLLGRSIVTKEVSRISSLEVRAGLVRLWTCPKQKL